MARDYTALGRGKTAAAHPFQAHMVITPDKGVMTRSNAESMGYTVPLHGELDQVTRDARIDQFMSLPEAAGKVRSAMRLAVDNPEMTLEQASGFLRGAYTDAAISAQRRALQPAPAAPPVDKIAARKAELASVAKAHMGRR